MKKFLFVFLISCFSLTIISCSDEKEESTTDTTTTDNTTTTTDNTTTTDDTTNAAILHQGYYWHSNNGSGDNGSVYCSNSSLSGRSWRVPKWTELQKLCLNPHSEIDVSRGNDNGTLMLAIYENFFNNGNSAYVLMCNGLCLGMKEIIFNLSISLLD